MKALIFAVLILCLGFAIGPARAQSVKLEKIPTKKTATAKKPEAKKTTTKAKTPAPKRSTASDKSKAKTKKPERATIKTTGGSTLGTKTKTSLPVKAANEAQKKKESLFKRRKKTLKSK